MILLTDGVPNITPVGGRKIHSLLEEADAIRAEGTKIVAIGVGTETTVDFELLEKITGDKSSVYFKKSFGDLKNGAFVEELAGSICVDPVLKTSVKPIARTVAPPKGILKILPING